MATLTGASVTINASNNDLLQQLRALADNPDTTALMHRLGEYFQESTQDRFKTQTDPTVARCSRRTNWRNVDFPEPDFPTKNTNSSRSISRETSSSAGAAPRAYTLVTFSKRIISHYSQTLALGPWT